MERRSLLEEAPKPFVEIVWIHAALCVHTNTLATPFPLSVSELEVSAATLFSRDSTRRTLKHDTVFRSFLFSDSQIPRLRHELRRHGGHQKARSHLWQNEVYQVRSECVTLCFGELTRVCVYSPKFVLKSQDPRFHGDIESELLIPRRVLLARLRKYSKPESAKRQCVISSFIEQV